MKLIVNIIKIVVLLASALALAAAALVGYDRYLRHKYPVRYISPTQTAEEEMGL